MKGRIGAVLLTLLLLLCAGALGEEAQDLTDRCSISVSASTRKYTAMTDRKYTSYWESKKAMHPSVSISSDTPVYGLYLCFRRMPEAWEIQTRDGHGETWVKVADGDTRFQHVYVPLEGLRTVRIYVSPEKKAQMGFNELFVLGEGEVPGWVQQWEETEEKADILFLVAHPDDELLFMGGAIPTYAVEKGKRVIVAYLTWSNSTRRSELLNGLWAMGVRHYPVIGDFSDRYDSKAADAYKRAGKNKVLSWVTGLFRQYRPEAVVTHDIDGEYGHGQHRMMADACIQCFDLAADASAYPEAGEPWEVKKLYIHLYGEEAEQTQFDWSVPKECFGGRSSLDLACDAYLLHVTQENAKIKIRGKWHVLSMEETGKVFDNTAFGLYATRVGADETHLDFLEHIQ